jgi:hypothetical protein
MTRHDILQKLRGGHKGSPNKAGFGNSVYNLEMMKVGSTDAKDDASILLTEEQLAASPWGNEYSFSLGDAVTDCVESIVYLPAVGRSTEVYVGVRRCT